MKTPDSRQPSRTTPHLSIAIIEDDDVQREDLVKWVTEMGHSAAPFTTASALLSAIQDTHFSLFLLEWELANRQGAELLRQLRADARVDAPIILCASRGAEADVAEALGFGADDFIVKPVRRSELAARIVGTLRRAHPG